MKIKIYTKSNCPNCTTAKQLLKSKGLEYDEFDAENIHVRADIEHNHPHIRQMPAIWVNGQYVGGLAGLQAALKQMGL
jgi:glutaredoxin 3